MSGLLTYPDLLVNHFLCVGRHVQTSPRSEPTPVSTLTIVMAGPRGMAVSEDSHPLARPRHRGIVSPPGQGSAKMKR
ncbi:hypothetical protein Micbo1qcDRAFT_163891 [Microdochium bolleyi]|uniref:Uncharacterized protein n=1 Tax=Microdochium bolleyi TaxID=196109 RepID=A0A136J1R4_9PEZI|nr:hypothetical protein Micbo1qcDRAFT_163891 [Microdochium bolleyi]